MAAIHDKFYPLKVWVATVVTGSFVFSVYDLFLGSNNNFKDFLGLLMTLLLFNFILSLPGLLIFYFGFEWVNGLGMSIKLKRWFLISLAFLLFLFTWYVINSLFGRDVFFSAKSIFIYSDFFACITVSSFIFGRSTAHNTGLPK